MSNTLIDLAIVGYGLVVLHWALEHVGCSCG
jgi:hypothetical protein